MRNSTGFIWRWVPVLTPVPLKLYSSMSLCVLGARPLRLGSLGSARRQTRPARCPSNREVTDGPKLLYAVQLHPVTTGNSFHHSTPCVWENYCAHWLMKNDLLNINITADVGILILKTGSIWELVRKYCKTGTFRDMKRCGVNKGGKCPNSKYTDE